MTENSTAGNRLVWLRSRVGALILAAMAYHAAPAEAQEADLLGLLRENGVAILLFKWAGPGFEGADRSDARARYFFASPDGQRGILVAEPVIDLFDDFDPVWGQRTDFEPRVTRVTEYPVPRVGYVVSVDTSHAPFLEVNAGAMYPDDRDLISLLDSLGPSSDVEAAPLRTRRTWRATLDSDTVVIFEADRVIRRQNELCFTIWGWFAPVRSPQLQVIGAEELGCGLRRVQPWAILRRQETLFAFLEGIGYDARSAQLWMVDEEGIWNLH